jgi:hypothetical protein
VQDCSFSAAPPIDTGEKGELAYGGFPEQNRDCCHARNGRGEHHRASRGENADG